MGDDNSTPYELSVQNNSTGNSCSLESSEEVTVKDMLDKLGVTDNISYYKGGQGNNDFILNIKWNSDFSERYIDYYLTGSKPGEVKNP